jgi:hypothetical protein
MSDPKRPAIVPGSHRDRLLRHVIHGERCVHLRRHHQPYTPDDGRQWVKGAHLQRCRACKTIWPCDPGLALAVIEYLLEMG